MRGHRLRLDIASSGESKVVSGQELVELFYYLRDRNPGNLLETLLYRQSSEMSGTEECMLWYMGDRRVLLSYRYRRDIPFTETLEVREHYEGTKLVRMEKRELEQDTLFDEETFPS